MQFDWDDGNRSKCLKHGLTISEIEFALANGARTFPDPAHSDEEERFIAVSRTAEGRAVFVACCWRGTLLRPISARYMHKKEAEHYARATHQSPHHDH